MALSMQERIKDLPLDRGLTLEQLAEQIGLSKSALGSYESDDFKDISHYALIKLADFYEVSVDYLPERTETKRPSNADETIDSDTTRHISIEIHFNLKPIPEVEQVTA